MMFADSESAPPVAAQEKAAAWLGRLGREVTAEAVAELAPYVNSELAAKGSPQAKAWADLVRRGQVPTPEAVAVRVVERAAFDQLRDGISDDVAGQVAAFVAGCVQATGRGPTWSAVGAQFGWSRAEAVVVLRFLRRSGWVEFTAESGSLRPGPLFHQAT